MTQRIPMAVGLSMLKVARSQLDQIDRSPVRVAPQWREPLEDARRTLENYEAMIGDGYGGEDGLGLFFLPFLVWFPMVGMLTGLGLFGMTKVMAAVNDSTQLMTHETRHVIGAASKTAQFVIFGLGALALVAAVSASK